MTTTPQVARILKRPGEDEAVTFYSIAKSTGLDPSYVSRIFSGDRRPSMDAASKIAAYLGVSMDAFHAALSTVRQKRGRERT